MVGVGVVVNIAREYCCEGEEGKDNYYKEEGDYVIDEGLLHY